MKIKEIMKKIVGVEKDISIREAAKIMSQKNIGSLVAIKNDKIVGIITEKDIMKNVGESGKKISTVMSKQAITIKENSSLEEAAEIMKKNSIKHLPVLGEDESLVGIITSTDLIANSEDLDEDFFM